jgi:hypothetical protein
VTLASCGRGNIYGRSPALEEYRENLDKLEVMLDEGSLFFGESPGPSETEYRELVAQYREAGLEALSIDGRRSLLMVAQLAFLEYVNSIRYVVTAEPRVSDGPGAAPARGIVEEVYRQRTVPYLSAARVKGTGIRWMAGSPERDPEAAEEWLILVEDVPEDAEFVTITGWERRTDEWTCTLGQEDSGEWFMVDFVRMRTVAGWPEGQLEGADTVDGRASYRFQGAEVIYWLDAETLWLRQYEYGGLRVKLEAVNQDIRIQPPDVDVGCVQETSQ